MAELLIVGHLAEHVPLLALNHELLPECKDKPLVAKRVVRQIAVVNAYLEQARRLRWLLELRRQTAGAKAQARVWSSSAQPARSVVAYWCRIV